MKTLSERAKLCHMYTNHCIRATVVTNLDKEGFEARQIRVASSHKSENSIKSYASMCPQKKKSRKFDALAKPFADPPKVPRQEIQNRIPNLIKNTSKNTPQTNQNLPTNEPNFQLVDLFPNMDEDPLNDDNFLAAIERIENENSQLVLINDQQEVQGLYAELFSFFVYFKCCSDFLLYFL